MSHLLLSGWCYTVSVPRMRLWDSSSHSQTCICIAASTLLTSPSPQPWTLLFLSVILSTGRQFRAGGRVSCPTLPYLPQPLISELSWQLPAGCGVPWLSAVASAHVCVDYRLTVSTRLSDIALLAQQFAVSEVPRIPCGGMIAR